MEFGNSLTTKQITTLKSVIQLAQTCRYDDRHTHHVTFLALKLFDQLQPLHGFGDTERFLLLCGTMLHDIGWIDGWKGHHKASLRIILNAPLLLFTHKERVIIGSIARYHRGKLPDPMHDHFATLNPDERSIVQALAACLRLADGLDRTHQSRVLDLKCECTAKKMVITCEVDEKPIEESQAIVDKGDLISRVFSRKLIIRWQMTE